MSINRVNISGNLTRDPELRATASGMPVLGFGVAVNDRAKNQQTGEWEDRPNFIDCTMFGARAQGVAQYLSKGSKVAIEGKLRWSQWEKDGQKRNKLEVVVDEVEFMQSRDQQHTYGAQQPQQYQQPQYAPQAAPQPAQQYQQQPQQYQQTQMGGVPAPMVNGSIYDEDIPF